MPVRKSQYIYSNLKNINGTVSSNSDEGIPLIKLKMLDVLLGRMKNSGSQNSDENYKLDDKISRLATNYRKEMQSDVSSAYTDRIEEGILLNLLC